MSTLLIPLWDEHAGGHVIVRYCTNVGYNGSSGSALVHVEGMQCQWWRADAASSFATLRPPVSQPTADSAVMHVCMKRARLSYRALRAARRCRKLYLRRLHRRHAMPRGNGLRDSGPAPDRLRRDGDEMTTRWQRDDDNDDATSERRSCATALMSSAS